MYDINQVRRGGAINTIHVQLIEKKRMDREKVHVYSGLEKLVKKYTLTLYGNQYSFYKKQQQTDMAFSLKVMGIITCISICMKKKDNLKFKTQFWKVKKNLSVYKYK